LTEVDAVVVSHDGLLGAIATLTQTTIVNLLNDQVVARVNSVVFPPRAFSWDDQLLVVDGSPKAFGELVSVSTGEVVWSDSVDRIPRGAVADPRSSDVMLFVATGGGPTDLLVVSPSGDSKVIATRVFPDAAGPCLIC
jgi:hypothetical protein